MNKIHLKKFIHRVKTCYNGDKLEREGNSMATKVFFYTLRP